MNRAYVLVARENVVTERNIGFALGGLPDDEWDLTACLHTAQLFQTKDDAEEEAKSLRASPYASYYSWSVKEVKLG